MIKTGVENPRKIPGFLYRRAMDQYRPLSTALTSRYPIGQSVFELDWDLLIVLDTCRPDALRRHQSSFSFLDEVDSVWSVGGHSMEWMAHTFDARYATEIADTAYVTANPHTETALEKNLDASRVDGSGNIQTAKWGAWNVVGTEELGHCEPIWQYDVPEEYAHPSPKYVTDAAIRLERTKNFDRMILHYMQPHHPYMHRAIKEGRSPHEYETHPLHSLKQGRVDRDTVFDTYVDELGWVLQDVETVLNNMDREMVVISADHGEAFGEYGVYGHAVGSLHPTIRRVPWVETTASDSGEYKPELEADHDANRSVRGALEALGYV
jgi:hypothetical protein